MAEVINTMEYRVLEPEQVTEFMREIKTGERVLSITGDDNVEHVVVLKKPTKQHETQARVFYVALFNKLLQNGIPPRVEARKTFLSLLKSNGVDPDTFEKKREEIHKKLAEKIAENANEANAKDALTSLPAMLQTLNQSVKYLSPDEQAFLETMSDNENLEAQIMSNCAEAMAETETQLFLLSQIAYNAEGKRLWPTPESLENETDLTFVVRLREEYQRWISGLPLFFEVRMPSRGEVPNESPSL